MQYLITFYDKNHKEFMFYSVIEDSLYNEVDYWLEVNPSFMSIRKIK